ncbi:MAG: fructose-bisphosphatase, class II [Acidobacteria bacterium RIFCSPHIGHO2_12_FULL_67_30]|nr:MAG: fructose-bisphosphatase, class II [Acidobacteria bacterium RIFCSPHIGHO2_02_FULL_67_57]OFV88671.1 MAG: fructose-bisphosphatase, class II [Acidobacteria bacterium RIFCSPHIGHO2_12_FULL_67_30]
MERDLSLEFLRVVEKAAIAAAHTMGYGDRHQADEAAVKAMRQELSGVAIRGRIVIGEGERDEAPMLYIGEEVGNGAAGAPGIDIAVDPLEGTNLCATGSPNAIAVIAASEPGGLLHAPDIYMEKLAVGPSCKGAVELDAPVKDNLQAIAKRLDRDVEDLVIVVLDRPRHEQLIKDIRAAGARIRLITDGDVAPAIAAAVIGAGVHAVMGIGAAPEGVLAAAALRCLNGEMQGRLVADKPEHRERLAKMGIKDPKRIYSTRDLAPGKNIVFACTGVTNGDLLRGVRFFGEGDRTHSLVMTLEPHNVRFVDAVHLERQDDFKVRFS